MAYSLIVLFLPPFYFIFNQTVVGGGGGSKEEAGGMVEVTMIACFLKQGSCKYQSTIEFYSSF